MGTTGHEFEAEVGAPVYLTGDAEGIGGRLKERPEDFFVEEVPLYAPSGEGEHIYMFVEKRSMSTLQLRDAIAKHFGVHPRSIGHAGLKDKHAVTRQVLSVHVPGKKPEDFPSFTHPKATILWVDLHKNKLQRGHLAGNRFSIRVRGVEAQAVLQANRALQEIARVGVPNRFGSQRFGTLGNNHLIGRAMILGDWDAALSHLLAPNGRAPSNQAEAREAFARGDFEGAFMAMPKVFKAERQALGVLKRGGEASAAIGSIDQTAAGFYVSSFQSAVFNRVLNDRVLAGTVGELGEGDLAFAMKSRKSFPITAETLGQEETASRLASFEIGPSGPMWGTTMARATGGVGERELAALTETGVSEVDLEACEARDGYPMIGGDRRPMRIPVIDPECEGGVDEHGAYVRCAFELPRGSFATTVMDEIMKVPLEGDTNG